jgi:hypothetical protein
MPPPSLSTLFAIGADILGTTVDAAKGTILAQMGSAFDNVVEANKAEWWQHVGFASRPSKPKASGDPNQGAACCQGIAIRRTDHDIIFGSRDLRSLDVLKNLDHGESAIFAAGPNGTGQAGVYTKGSGAVVLATTDDNTKTGNAVFFKIAPTELRFESPYGKQWQDANGWHLRTWQGASIDVGGFGLPSPLNIGSSDISLSADRLALDAALLVLGRDSGNTQPGVLSTQLLAFIAVQSAALEAITALVDAILSVLTGLAVTMPGPMVGATLAALFTPALDIVAATATTAVAAASVPPILIQSKTSIA